MIIQLTANRRALRQYWRPKRTRRRRGRARTYVFERLIQLGEGLHALIADLIDPDRHFRLLVDFVLQHSLDDLPSRAHKHSAAR